MGGSCSTESPTKKVKKQQPENPAATYAQQQQQEDLLHLHGQPQQQSTTSPSQPTLRRETSSVVASQQSSTDLDTASPSISETPPLTPPAESFTPTDAAPNQHDQQPPAAEAAEAAPPHTQFLDHTDAPNSSGSMSGGSGSDNSRSSVPTLVDEDKLSTEEIVRHAEQNRTSGSSNTSSGSSTTSFSHILNDSRCDDSSDSGGDSVPRTRAVAKTANHLHLPNNNNSNDDDSNNGSLWSPIKGREGSPMLKGSPMTPSSMMRQSQHQQHQHQPVRERESSFEGRRPEGGSRSSIDADASGSVVSTLTLPNAAVAVLTPDQNTGSLSLSGETESDNSQNDSHRGHPDGLLMATPVPPPHFGDVGGAQ